MDNWIIYLILSVIFWCYSSSEGIKDKWLYYYRNGDNKAIKTELHPLFAFQRICVAAIILILTKDYLFVFSLGLSFSFWHNGFYYWQGNKIDPNLYPLKFIDHSTTSSAKIELSFEQRLWLFVFGITLFGLDCILTIHGII